MRLRTKLAALLAILGVAACQEATPYMTLSEKNVAVTEDGGEYFVSISANVHYRINNDMDWTSVDVEESDGETARLKLTVQPNQSSEARTGRVRFIGDYVTPLYVSVNQDGKAPVGVTVNEISVGYTETTASFGILGVKPWTASCDNPDFQLSATSGVGETDITLTFSENTDTAERIATVTVKIGNENYYVKIIQGGAPSKERVDLSEAGTSNCYIVDKPGYYKFKAGVRGTGFVPESCASELSAAITPVKAAVLWCTTNSTVAPESTDAIITGVGLEDGYVVFNTANMVELVPGNVVVAVYDAAGVILWSWHVWLSAAPAVSEIGGTFWMDRNLGAVNAVRGDAGSIGLLYQWGRKDPMRGASSFTDGDFIATCPAPTPEEVEVPTNAANGTVLASIANPRPFINTLPGGSGPKDWVFATDHDDRWMDGNKTMFDPCPAGYRVPTTAQMAALATASGLPTGSAKYSSNAAAKEAFNAADHVFETAVICLPICGYIAYNDGTLLTDVNACAKYVTSSRAKAPSSYYLNANGTACNFTNSATCGHASSVRCVKE